MRRSSTGGPQPITLAEAQAELQCSERQLQRLIKVVGERWVVRRAAPPQEGPGRAPREECYVWVLLPGEPVIV